MFRLLCALLILILGLSCSIKKDIIYEPSVLKYHFDTITKTYLGDFTKGYTGGIDLYFRHSSTYLVYNCCGSEELKIVDHQSDSIFSVPHYNPDCAVVFSNIKNEGVYFVTTKGEIRLYCFESGKNELYFDLNNDSVFKKSGLRVEQYKPGSDQFISLPNDILYFRVMKDFDVEDGKYSVIDYNYPVFVKYNLESHDIQFYGKLPKVVAFQEYGLLSEKFDLYIGDSILTSESYSDKIEIINTRNNTIKTLHIKSKYDTKHIKKWIYSPKMKDAKTLKMQHCLESSNYEPLFYNPYNKKYYRIFHPALEKYDENEFLNTDSDKKVVLMVFNKELKLIDEVLLPIHSNHILKLIPCEHGVDLYLPERKSLNTKKITYSFLRVTHE